MTKSSERETSDYRNFSTFEIKLFPDLIPIVGLATCLRRKGVVALSEELKSPSSAISSVFSLGLSRWPRPVDSRAWLRCQAVQARNVAFVTYHTAPIFFGGLALLRAV